MLTTDAPRRATGGRTVTDVPPAARPTDARRKTGRRVAGLAVALVVLGGAIVASIALGARSIAVGDVFDALFAFDGSSDQVVVRSLRAPRTVVGLGVGVALGLAGTVMQG